MSIHQHAHAKQVSSDALPARSTGTANRERTKDQTMADMTLTMSTESASATGEQSEGERVCWRNA